MSSYTQDYVYKFGKKHENAKENVMTSERLEYICKSAEKYMNKAENENKKNTVKQ